MKDEPQNTEYICIIFLLYWTQNVTYADSWGLLYRVFVHELDSELTNRSQITANFAMDWTEVARLFLQQGVHSRHVDSWTHAQVRP